MDDKNHELQPGPERVSPISASHYAYLYRANPLLRLLLEAADHVNRIHLDRWADDGGANASD